MTIMPLDGDLEAVELSNGMYRFRYILPGGAEFHGAKQYTTKAAAIKGGKKWLSDEANIHAT